MRLGSSTWPDVDAARLVLVVPLGSCEQHGPHLPLDTDARIAVAVAEGLEARRPGRVAVAPTLAYGASGEHQGFPGTLSIGLSALELVLVELVRSADAFQGVVLVNGHGGNSSAVEAAVATSTVEGRHVLAWSPRVVGGDAHAGRTETSLLLAPTLGCVGVVRLDRAVAGATAPLHELEASLRSLGVRAVSPTGVLGDPAGASAAEGDAVLTALVDDLERAFVAWAEALP